MKKTMIISFVALCAFMASCSDPKTYDVTVIGRSVGVVTATQKAIVGIQSFDAITTSGDTVQVNIDEKILLENTIPFQAIMKKRDTERFGQIVSAK